MRLTRKTNTPATTGLGISRRQFLKRTGVATGGVAAAGFMGAPMMQRTEAADKTPVLDSPVETKRTICSHRMTSPRALGLETRSVSRSL